MDFLQKYLLLNLSKYVVEFLDLLCHPKKFLALKNGNPDEELDRALIFMGLSFAIGVALNGALTTQITWTEFLFVRPVWFLLYIVILAAALRFSWLCVGACAPFLGFLVTFLYYMGVLTVMVCAVLAPLEAIFKHFDPTGYGKFIDLIHFRSAQHRDALSSPWLAAPISGILLVNIMELAWTVAVWGAYRKLTDASRLRSFLAFVIFSFLERIVTVIFVFFFLILF